MSQPSQQLSERERRLHEVIARYLEAVAAGQAPEREELLTRHADLADDLRAFFADHPRLQKAAGLDTPAASEPERVRYVGDYELLEELGRGGMGVVYKARQVSLGRPVALKMILAGHLAADADVRRFRAEAENV